MVNTLSGSVSAYRKEIVKPRFIRIDEVMALLDVTRDEASRNGEAHYGMGLFFAKTVAEKYGGGIKLSNSENTGGARVEIFFLSSQETS